MTMIWYSWQLDLMIFNIDKLKDPHVAKVFEANTGRDISRLNLVQDIDPLKNKGRAYIETATKIVIKDRKKTVSR